MPSTLEAAFAHWWALLAPDLPAPEVEYRFHPTRRWRMDFAWPEHQVYVECDGGTYMQGRHTRGAGYANDCAKLNAATMLGWRGLRFTTDMLQHEPELAITQLRALLEDAR